MPLSRPLAFALALAIVAVPVFAQQRVYQWKDANGVTHYTDVVPSQQHQTRDINARPGTTASPAVAGKQADSPQCSNARANLQRLQGSAAIGIDSNGDGSVDRNLSADERKAQLDLNQAAVKAYCTPAKS